MVPNLTRMKFSCTINKTKEHMHIQVLKVSDPRITLKPQADKCWALVSTLHWDHWKYCLYCKYALQHLHTIRQNLLLAWNMRIIISSPLISVSIGHETQKWMLTSKFLYKEYFHIHNSLVNKWQSSGWSVHVWHQQCVKRNAFSWHATESTLTFP